MFLAVITDFVEWLFGDFLSGVQDAALVVAKVIMYVIIAVVTLPLWILPFIYWFIFERRKR